MASPRSTRGMLGARRVSMVEANDVERPGWAYVGSRGTTDESRCRSPTTSRRMNSAILYVCAIANDARQVQASL